MSFSNEAQIVMAEFISTASSKQIMVWASFIDFFPHKQELHYNSILLELHQIKDDVYLQCIR